MRNKRLDITSCFHISDSMLSAVKVDWI